MDSVMETVSGRSHQRLCLPVYPRPCPTELTSGGRQSDVSPAGRQRDARGWRWGCVSPSAPSPGVAWGPAPQPAVPTAAPAPGASDVPGWTRARAVVLDAGPRARSPEQPGVLPRCCVLGCPVRAFCWPLSWFKLKEQRL